MTADDIPQERQSKVNNQEKWSRKQKMKFCKMLLLEKMEKYGITGQKRDLRVKLSKD